MVKVLGKLIALVIEGEDCLEKGQHLQKSKAENILITRKIIKQNRNMTTCAASNIFSLYFLT